MMTNFDAAGRESCVVRETRTNTPLQALNLMNDVTFIEAARFIGQRMMKEGGADEVAAAAWVPPGARARMPTEAEHRCCESNCNYHRDYFASDPTKATGLLKEGDSPARSESRSGGTGRLRVCRQPDPESRRSDHEGMSIDPITERSCCSRAAISSAGRQPASAWRRWPRCSAQDLRAPTAALPGLAALSPRKRSGSSTCFSTARPRSWICSITSPAEDRRGLNLPDSIRKGQRLTGMTAYQTTFPIAPSVFKFAQHGQSGDVAERTAAAHREGRRRSALIRSMHTEAINHDPAMTFFQTGFQLAGRPSIGSWLSYGLGSENKDLPAFVVMVSQGIGETRPGALRSRCGAAGFCPPSTRA